MILSVYLHKDRADVLRTFGSLDEVVDRILSACDEGEFDIENKPECEPRDGASRYNIKITNESYIDMLKNFGVKCKRISLRRLLYWFVDNEIYADLGWETVNDYIDSDSIKTNAIIDKLQDGLDKLMLNVKSFEQDTVIEIKNLLNNMRK